MELTTAFDQFQTAVNADPTQLKAGRDRRDLFKTAFDSEPDVDQVFASGSLARGTMLEPIHDVDIVIVFDADEHPSWGSPGDSAADALTNVSGRVNTLLGATNGTVAQAVRLAKPRNHSVKCFFDDPKKENAFTVDATPALRQPNGTLLVPEALSSKWIEADPQDLIRRIAQQHKQWNRFVPMVRVLKHWNKAKGVGMKSLTVEVLAYEILADQYRTGDDEVRPDALLQFFTAAQVRILEPICDPAGLCGEIQPELDRDWARRKVEQATDAAVAAVTAARDGDVDLSICRWRGLFGDKFPEPPGGCDSATTGSGGKWAAGATVARAVRDTPQG